MQEMKILVLVLCGIFVLANGVGYASGRKPSEPSPSARDQSKEGDIAGAISQTPPLPLLGDIITTKYCVICGRKFPETTQVCPTHGVPLKYKSQRGQVTPQAPQPQAQPQAASVTMFCPTCGKQYTGDYSYCTADGTKLEPIQ